MTLVDPPPPHPDASTERKQIRTKIGFDLKFVNVENVNLIMLLHCKLLDLMAAQLPCQRRFHPIPWPG